MKNQKHFFFDRQRLPQARLMLLIGMVTTMLTVGCGGINSGMVDGGEPIPGVAGAFYSRRDNPVIRGTDRLDEYFAENGKPDRLESIVVGFDGEEMAFAINDFFDLRVEATGKEGFGTPASQLIETKPKWKFENQSLGFDKLDARSENPKYEWSANGILLGRNRTTIQTFHTDAWGGRRAANPVPLQVELAPGTALVPVQVVRVLHQSMTDASASMQYRQGSYYKLFDDLRFDGPAPIIKSNTKSGEVFQNEYATVHVYNSVAKFPFIQPDATWEQCGIQFRLVSVNDLYVDDINLARINGCLSTNTPEIVSIRAQIKTQLGKEVREDIPLIIAVETVGSCSYRNRHAHGPGWAVVPVNGRDKYDMSHQLGHILGLGENNRKGRLPGSGNLMSANGRSGNILEEDCKLAKKLAETYSGNYWDRLNLWDGRVQGPPTQIPGFWGIPRRTVLAVVAPVVVGLLATAFFVIRRRRRRS